MIEREEILNIASDLREGSMTAKEAKKELLHLFGVESNVVNKKVTYITCSAIWFKNDIKYDHQPFNIKTGFVICGHRHHNCFMTAYILNKDKKLNNVKEIQGFMTSDNNFVDRKEAAQIAFQAGQIDEMKSKLFSEDLY